jgi:hypothetical protein
MPTAPRRTTARTETPGTTTTTTDETAEVAPSATADDTPSSGRATATKRTAQSRTARKNDTARTDTATGGTVADTATTDLARTGTATDRPAGVPTPGTAAETATSDQATGQAQAAARALTGTAGWRRTRWSGQPERRRGGGRYGGRHRVGCRDLAAHGRHHAGDGGREVVDDVVSTVRRPDGALYLGGLVGLAALGVLEWPEPRPSVWGSRRQRGPAQSRRPAGSTARRGLIGAVPAGHESEPG